MQNRLNQSTIFICAFIFLLSIYLRSMIDIGGDSGFYLDLGQRIAHGKKYYYDFFESNFPLSFYFYAFQFKLASALHISPIIMSEIFTNLLGIFSLFCCINILKNVEFEKKQNFDLLIISFFLSFFLRINALAIGEFGTKTSLFLLLILPYFSYNFLEQNSLTKKDLIIKGSLMALCACLKPHYAIFIIIFESYNFWQEKSLRFFIKTDKLIALAILLLYTNFLIFKTPEFLQFMVPMWSEFYSAYSDFAVFLNNIIKHLSNKILLFCLIFVSFLYLKPTKTDKILLLGFLSSCLLLLIENIGTIDQEVIFYTFTTIIFSKISYDFFTSKYIDLKQNKFVIISIIILIIFDAKNTFKAFTGLINIWFALIPFCFLYFAKFKKEFLKIKISKRTIIFSLTIYFLFSAIAIFSLNKFSLFIASLINLILFFIILFLFEKRHQKIYNKFSIFLIIIVTLLSANLASLYIKSIKNILINHHYFATPNELSQDMAMIVKKFAPQKDDSFLVMSNWISREFPLMNYLNKQNYFKYAIAYIYDGTSKNTIFSLKPGRAFVYNYLFDDLKKQLSDKNIKVIFANSGEDGIVWPDRCNIRILEYYLQDPAFKKLFLQNFHFENHLIKYKPVEEKFEFKNNDIFDSLQPSSLQVLYDFEVYVRN